MSIAPIRQALQDRTRMRKYILSRLICLYHETYLHIMSRNAWRKSWLWQWSGWKLFWKKWRGICIKPFFRRLLWQHTYFGYHVFCAWTDWSVFDHRWSNGGWWFNCCRFICAARSEHLGVNTVIIKARDWAVQIFTPSEFIEFWQQSSAKMLQQCFFHFQIRSLPELARFNLPTEALYWICTRILIDKI